MSLPPGTRTGLKQASQVMVDKLVSVPRTTVGDVIGECSPDELDAVADGLRRWLGVD